MTDFAGWRDRFSARDPGRVRLTLGLRSMLATALAALACFPAASALGLSTTAAYPGVMLAMSAAAVVNEPGRDATKTIAWSLVPSVAGLAAGLLVAPYDHLRVLLLAVVVFLAVWARRFGARGFALGFIGFMAYFVAVFFAAPLSLLLPMCEGVLLALVATAVVRVALLPDHPDKVVAHARRSFRSLVALILEELPQLVSRPDLPRSLRVKLGELRKAALQLGEQLEAAPDQHVADAWRDAVVEQELAVEAAIDALRALRGMEPLRRPIVAALHAARMEVRRPSPGHQHRFEALLTRAQQSAPEPAREPLRQLCRALHEVARDRAVPALQMTGTAVLPLVKLPPAQPGKLLPTTRLAIQAAIATSLAALAGHVLSTARWYWAVIAAFVVFNSAATAGDAMVRAWHRTLGTAAGVIAGFAAVEAARHHQDVEVGLLFVCIFLGFYAFRRSYFWLVVCITALIAVFYSLVGRFTPGILFLRLEETVIGAAIAVLVASLVLRAPTLERAKASVEAELRAIRGVLDALPDAQALRVRTREHDRALLDVVHASELLQSPPLARRHGSAALPVHDAVLLGHRTRLLATAALRSGRDVRGEASEVASSALRLEAALSQ